MKTRFIHTILILSFAAITLSFSFTEENYLPTAIHITSGKFDKELLLNLRASFATRKIKTISKEESMELQRMEHERVMKPYYENLKRTGSSLPPFDEIKVYMSLNSRKVCNSLSIDINVTDDGIIKDTIKWTSRTLPFDFLDMKKDQHVLVLRADQKTSILNITQLITDSIIASNVLVKQ